MLGINVKRGIESTFDRVYRSTNNRFQKIRCTWSGTTAGIHYRGGICTVIFPAIGDTADISTAEFNRLVGYALHELGHAWFTIAKPWDDAVREAGADGPLLHNLINGLEDPRIELCVIRSGYAANARPLFESLTNHLLSKVKTGDYVNPDDLKNVAFQLAIEGRRLNGYGISVKSVWERSKYAAAINAALQSAHAAASTEQIVLVAQRLLLALKQIEEKPKQPPQPPQPPEDGEGEGEGEGEAEGESEGEGEAEGEGEGGKEGEAEGKGEGEGEGEGESEGDGEGGGEGEENGGAEVEVEDEGEGETNGGGKGGNDEQRNFDVSKTISEDCASKVDTRAFPNEGRIQRTKIVFKT